MRNWYIADTHFGHCNVIRFDGRPFGDVEEMDRVLMENWNARVGDGDDVYVLGDFCYRSGQRSGVVSETAEGQKTPGDRQPRPGRCWRIPEPWPVLSRLIK